jgi:putative heme iron utilization protein
MADEGPSVNEFGQAEPAEDAWAARKLLRGAREATLATVTDGQPFASLVTPACAPDLGVLLWLSTLSAHTRHLMRDPRCALLVTGEASGPNPQTRPRVTVTGQATRVDGEDAAALKAIWLARHPYAALYADFADFGLWRIAPQAALFVGGFARARPIAAAALLPEAGAVAAIAAAEPGIVQHMNEDHADAVDAIARGLLAQNGSGWRFAGVDVDGCWLTLGEGDTMRQVRFDFDRPVATPVEVRDALVAATRAARTKLPPAAG